MPRDANGNYYHPPNTQALSGETASAPNNNARFDAIMDDLNSKIPSSRISDGAESGLDADKLDGQEGAFYQNASNLNAGTVPAARLSGAYNISITGNAATATNAGQLGGRAANSFPYLSNDVIVGAEWFKATTGGAFRVVSTSNMELYFNGALHYRIQGGGWIGIATTASDVRFKELTADSSDPISFVKSVDPIVYTPKADAPIHMPEGKRFGFSAQNLQAIDPSLVQEVPIPHDLEYEKDKDGNLILDQNGAPTAKPHPLDSATYLALAPDAQYQLLARLYSAVEVLAQRVEQLEGKATS